MRPRPWFAACRVAQYPFKADQPVQGTDWEAYVAQIAGEMLAEQSPKRLLQIRGRLYGRATRGVKCCNRNHILPFFPGASVYSPKTADATACIPAGRCALHRRQCNTRRA